MDWLDSRTRLKPKEHKKPILDRFPMLAGFSSLSKMEMQLQGSGTEYSIKDSAEKSLTSKENRLCIGKITNEHFIRQVYRNPLGGTPSTFTVRTSLYLLSIPKSVSGASNTSRETLWGKKEYKFYLSWRPGVIYSYTSKDPFSRSKVDPNSVTGRFSWNRKIH